MNGPRTALEALTVELLGDVGRLHEAVQRLNASLPREMDAAEERIVKMIGLLNKAGDAYLQTVKTFTASELNSIRSHLDGRTADAKREFALDAAAIRKELEARVRNSLEDINKMIHSSDESAFTRKAQEAERRTRWTTVGLCFASSVLGALVTLAIFSVFR